MHCSESGPGQENPECQPTASLRRCVAAQRAFLTCAIVWLARCLVPRRRKAALHHGAVRKRDDGAFLVVGQQPVWLLQPVTRRHGAVHEEPAPLARRHQTHRAFEDTDKHRHEQAAQARPKRTDMQNGQLAGDRHTGSTCMLAHANAAHGQNRVQNAPAHQHAHARARMHVHAKREREREHAVRTFRQWRRPPHSVGPC